MKRTAASMLLLALTSCAASDARPDLGALLRPHDDHPVQVVALVVDLDTGEILFSREAQRLVRPASTMKVLTTAAVCRRAPDGVLETTLSADNLPDGVVTLTGGADPFLSTEDLHTLVRDLKELGLKSVHEGRVNVVDPLADAPRFGEGWMWDDEPASFMPAISAAPVNGGCVTVLAHTTDAGLEATMLPVAGGMQLQVQPGADRLRVTRGRYATPELVTVTGSVPDGLGMQPRISVPDPARFTAWVLADALEKEGLLAGAPVVSSGGPLSVPFAGAHSVTLQRSISEVVKSTNKPSDNLGAELLLRLLPTLAAEDATLGPGSAADGIALIGEDLARLGLDPSDYRISDGSGVSHYTLISAEVLVRTLEDMYRIGGRSFEVFETSLPIAGVDGTLRQRMLETAAKGRVHAKTGTISGVSNLAGYVTTESGRNLAFAIMVQNYVGSAKPWRELQDAFCVELAEL